MRDSRRCECGHYRVDHNDEKPRWFETFAYGAMSTFFKSRLGECCFCDCVGYLYKEGSLEAKDNPGVRTPILSA